MNEGKLNVAPVADDPPRQEAFLDRWSRVKREVKSGAVPPGTVETEEPLELPSLEALAAQGLEGNFSAFMQTGVDAGVRRAAIQQLFRQPVFNVMDGLDVYIEDFNIYEPLTAEALPGLAHARSLLFPEVQEVETKVASQVVPIAEAGNEPPHDEAVSHQEQQA